MHWIKATGFSPIKENDRVPVYINMAAVQTMVRGANATSVLLGGIAVEGFKDDNPNTPNTYYSNTQVHETPEELLAMPAVDPAARLSYQPPALKVVPEKPRKKARA